MGIMNLSPESFSGDGILQPRTSNSEDYDLHHFKNSVESMYRNFDRKKISIVDVGAASTSPSSFPVTRDEEMRRINYYLDNTDINYLRKFPHSVDSYRFEAVQQYINFDSNSNRNRSFLIVNDISGTRDTKMIMLLKKYKLGLILTHRHPESNRLHDKFQYDDAIEEVKEHLYEQVKFLINQGFSRSSIAIDPGLGFGKQPKDSYYILDNIDKLYFGFPIVVGFSNKQFSLEFNMTNSELINHAFSKKVSIVRTHLKMQE